MARVALYTQVLLCLTFLLDLLPAGLVEPAALAAVHSHSRSFFQALPWYHSADDIKSTVASLAENCKNAKLTKSTIKSDDGVALDVVRIGRGEPADKMKAMMFFGVHSREIFGTETGLEFMKTLCGEGEHEEWASKLLDSVQFTIVPNANPIGRLEVEKGDFCKRTNEHGVDLNRNWGFDGHSGPEDPQAENNPGPHSFSEPESVLLKNLVDKEKPTMFLDIHTGSYLLGTPWTYDPHKVPKDQPAMLEMLDKISTKYCQGNCPFGNAAELVGYPAPGTDMDYVKAKAATPFVFTWEIYVGPSMREGYEEKAREQREKADSKGDSKSSGFLELGHRSTSLMRNHHHKGGVHSDTLSGKTRTGAKRKHRTDDQACLEQFNPLEKEETRSLATSWSKAYLDLTDMVLQRVKDGKEKD